MHRLFLNTFYHKIDNQRRIAIPKDWRAGAGEQQQFVMIPDRDHAIQVMPHKYYLEEVVARLTQNVNFTDKRKVMEKLGSRAHQCIVDKNHRISLTSFLEKHAQLELNEQVQLTGSINYFKIGQVKDLDFDIDSHLDEIDTLLAQSSQVN